MSVYDKLAASATTLLAKYGRDVTRRRLTPGAYDASTGSLASTTADLTFKGALFSFKDGQTEFNAALIQANDRRMLVEAAAAPTVDDLFLVAGVQYAVVAVKEVNPAGVPVLYSMHVRR